MGLFLQDLHDHSLNFLIRRRFFSLNFDKFNAFPKCGFPVTATPASSQFVPVVILSLSYYLSFYPFSLLLSRLTMTHDACVWIAQNPPINQQKTANHQLFQHVRFATEPATPKPSRNFPPLRHIQQYGFHCFLLLFPVFELNASVYDCSSFVLLFVTFVWFRFDSCMLFSNYCSFKHVTTFVQYDDLPLLTLIR